MMIYENQARGERIDLLHPIAFAIPAGRAGFSLSDIEVVICYMEKVMKTYIF